MPDWEIVETSDGRTWEIVETSEGTWAREARGDQERDEALCVDCGRPTTPEAGGDSADGTWEWFSVHNAVWDEAEGGRGPNDYLCVGCLEARLGRRLTRHDFSGWLINRASPLDTLRLTLRMT